MEKDYKKLLLEAAIKAVKDQISKFGTFEQANPQLSVLILNLKSIVDGVNERKGCDAEDAESIPVSNNFKNSEFQKAVAPSLHSTEDTLEVGDKTIQNLQDTLNAVEVQIRAFQYFSSDNLRLFLLCKMIRDIIENVNETMLEQKIHLETAFKVLTEADATKAVRALKVRNKVLPKTKEEAKSTVKEVEDVSKIAKRKISEPLVSDKEPAQKINSFLLPDCIQEEVDVDIRSSEKCKKSKNVENILPAADLVDEVSSDEASTEAGNLLRQVLTNENYEIKLIEQVVSNSNKVKELCDRMKKDIIEIVIPSLKQKKHLESLSILNEQGVSQSDSTFEPSTTPPVPCSKTLEIIAQKKSQDDLIVIYDSIRDDPNIKTVNAESEVSKETELPNSKELPKLFQSKPQVDKTNEFNKMPKPISKNRNHSSRWASKPVTAVRESRQIFIKMTEPILDFEIGAYFGRMGLVVTDIQSHLFKVPSRSSAGYAFVTFNSVETVQELLKIRDRDIFGIKVRISEVKGKDHKESYNYKSLSSRLLGNARNNAENQNLNTSEVLKCFDKVRRAYTAYRHHPYLKNRL